jgi:hypothetical protein
MNLEYERQDTYDEILFSTIRWVSLSRKHRIYEN